jgi:hypothetical protein
MKVRDTVIAVIEFGLLGILVGVLAGVILMRIVFVLIAPRREGDL